MSEMLNSLFVGKKTSDALVCKAKCIGIMIGLAAGAAMGYAAAMCMSPSCDGAKLRKENFFLRVQHDG